VLDATPPNACTPPDSPRAKTQRNASHAKKTPAPPLRTGSPKSSPKTDPRLHLRFLETKPSERTLAHAASSALTAGLAHETGPVADLRRKVRLDVRDYHRRAMPSQWLAVSAGTDPLRHARELQRSWERLLSAGALGPELPPEATAGLRPTIVESWRRSLATGLDPTDLLAPIEADESEVLELWFEHPLGPLTQGPMEQLRKMAEESRGMVVVTDASGLVLHRVGDEWLKERAAEMNLVEGARLSEAVGGTNGIGTALAADHALQVFAFEHFNERNHQWICSGAPVHDPVSGQTIGLIDLSSSWKTAHPRSLELVTAAARTMEQSLLGARRDRDARLRRRYGDLMTRSTDLLVNRDGYVLAGAETASSKPLDIPEGGGEVVLSDGSVAVAALLGQGEAYLLRHVTTHHATSAPVEVLERAEKHIRELVTEQSALRQVATLVARESAPDRLFAAVTEQVARVFDVPHVRLVRYEPEGWVIVGGFSEGDHEAFPIGSRWPDSPGVLATVRQTGRPARVEDYAHLTGAIAAVVRDAAGRSAVGSPIVVERRLWGAMVVLSPRHEPFPEDTEARLTDFTELVATAIANAESRQALAAVADEQAALRRVATLVASGGGPEPLFHAVADEVQGLFASSTSGIVRFEDDGTATTLGTRGGGPAAGTRSPVDPDFVMGSVRRTGRAARFDTDDPTVASMPAIVREFGVRSAVASPIVVEGELWGAIGVGSLVRSLPPDTERRLADFTELVATAIANAESQSELIASRARIVSAGDEARRRIERNLHDGTQQRLIALGLDLQRVRATIRADPAEQADFERMERDLESILEDLRELSHGLHPPLLSRAGLRPSLEALARRSPIPVQLDVDLPERPPTAVETAIYYLVSEALANAIKHSHASAITVTIAGDPRATVHAAIADDGVGGAEPSGGSGLIGLTDRVEALGGTISITSPPRGGTTLSVRLPIAT
jgi:signal transduction histidine kinase